MQKSKKSGQTKNRVAHKITDVLSATEIKNINSSFSENALGMMRKRYLLKVGEGFETPAEMYHRVAHGMAEVEKNYGHDKGFITKTEKEFFDVLARKEFTPAGRTLTNTGAGSAIVANCIVLPVHDTMDSIFQTLKDASLLQQAGSGLGFDFGELRPAMTATKRSRGVSSGPVSFLKVYNEAFGVIKQQGRHGANMAMMSIEHPDIIDFIRAKQVEGEISNFNISVKVTDAFMKALVNHPNEQWYCEWRGEKTKPHKIIRTRNGNVVAVEEVDMSTKELFDEIVSYAWLNGEPGIVFIDEVNRTNPLPDLGEIRTSNPCGEQFLHAYDNCNLGSINLAAFVKAGKVDWDHLRAATKTATRMLDNVIDLFDFPVAQVTEMASKNRRIGLGIMGFADMLFELGVPYNSPEGLALGEQVIRTINTAAHEMSQSLAKEKGVFPNLPLSIYAKKKIKMRNAALTTVAPTGSISMMLDCSSGIEPNFALSYVKQDKDGKQYHYFNRYFKDALAKCKLPKEKIEEAEQEIVKTGSIAKLTWLPEKLRETFVVAMDISAEDHMKMQAAFQRNVDNSISKTINFPNSATKEDVENGFVTAWRLKCKSCTVYREGSREVQILNLGTGENIKAPTELGGKSQTTIAKSNLSIDAGRVAAKERPEVMSGKTYKVKTGYGNMYITINNDEDGVPFEVFATIGKSGGFFQEQSEGICRLISLALRSGVKVEQVINNLKGIRGPMPMMTNKGTILSLPDAIGRVLEEHVHGAGVTSDGMIQVEVPEKEPAAIGASLFSSGPTVTGSAHDIADTGMMPGCPECGGPLYLGEGCLSCKNCGYSRCE